MNNSLSAMDAALATLNLTDPLYKTLYNAYLQACANHKITRSGKWNKTYNQAEINGTVNMSPYLTSEWYHQSESQGTHTIYARGSWSFSDLKELHPCNGPCTVKHRTHWEAFDAHLTSCGTAVNIDKVSELVEAAIYQQSYSELVNYPNIDAYILEVHNNGTIIYIGVIATGKILEKRSAAQGCGRSYYKCPSLLDHSAVQEHQERTCNTVMWEKPTGTLNAYKTNHECERKYRNCMGHTRVHNPDAIIKNSKHSDDGSDSTEEANAGGTLHACDIHDTSVSGDHSSTWLCNESPCSNLQVPYCLAICPETGNHGTATTPTTPAMVVCDIAGCQDSTPYDPTSSSAGLHAYCNECSQYKCTGGGHSWYPSCTDTTHTNSNGDSCTVAGYECVSHTPVYPAPPPTTVSCGGCSVSYDPQGSLAWRHEYIPCPRTRIAHDLACGASFYRCSNTNTCIWNWRHSSWNDDPEL